MRVDHSNEVEEIVTVVFGECPDSIKKMYRFYESKIPNSEQGDFLSLVAVELLDRIVTKLPVDNIENAFKKILERVVKRLFRAAKRLRNRETSFDGDIASASNTQQREQHREIVAAINGFEPNDILLVLMKLEGHTLSQIASTLGLSTTKVHRRWRNIRDRLREKLSQEN
jgi:RNA polymerase sigma factor (sigma-70 family)